LRHVQRAAQAHIEDAVVVRAGDLERLDRLRDAGVVDQDVDAAEGLDRLRGGGFAGGLVRNVAHHAQVAVAELRRRRCRLGACEVHDDDPGALRRHLPRGGKAESVDSRAAGDDGYLVLEKHLCSSPVLRNVWSERACFTTSEVSSG
jgi:hypothetical protein